VASLAAVVKACAKDGDKVAINILDEAVTELVCSVKAVVQSLTLHGEGIFSMGSCQYYINVMFHNEVETSLAVVIGSLWEVLSLYQRHNPFWSCT
jgi:N-acetylglucosamine kinase-like BadF-type ATPase